MNGRGELQGHCTPGVELRPNPTSSSSAPWGTGWFCCSAGWCRFGEVLRAQLPLFAPLLLALPAVSATGSTPPCLSVPPRNVSFRCLQISSFANSTWTRTDMLTWLGDLQTVAWPNDSDSIHFLKPWSQGRFSRQQWNKLQHVLWVYRSSFTRDIKEFAIMLRRAYPLELQLAAGCEAYPGNASENYVHVAFQGSHILTFQGTSWEAAPDAPSWLNPAIEELNKDQGTRETVHSLLSDTCPQVVSGLLEAGKSELERQVKPEAWLSSGPSPGPGRLQLVCHVSGFHPKPVWVTWMRGEQEQKDIQRGDVLPNADETWYLRVTLDVAAGEAAGLSCRVKHSSLGGQDIVLHWDSSSHFWVALVCLMILIALGVGLVIWMRRRSSYQDLL
ncbi:antigen-presenting glycoprotein CD1d isoform X1 [Fukomys damarensis]|uniref:antigen-presenting glycoprotein CD1d isoform X1 n=2 Tax=Fukomys damarensis TaxID=885580 RepID=UPI00053FF8E5|nr:antigen-presenting glycoprotein CD1d isoform X1 [Fukomys damarensis]